MTPAVRQVVLGRPGWISSPANLIYAESGDSRANAGLSNTAVQIKFKSLGARHWAAQLLGQRFIRDTNDYGTGGATTADELVKFPARLAANNAATWRHISGGNDIIAARTLAQIQDDYRAMAALAYAARRRFVVGETPFSTAVLTAPQQQTQSDLDDWLRVGLPAQFRNVFHSGSYRAVAVNASGPTDPAAGVSYDGKHMFSYGAWLMAQTEKNLLAQLFPGTASTFPLADISTVAYNASTAPFGSLVSNWLLTGTNGSAPTGWTLTTLSGITAAWTYGTDADGFNEAILTLSGTPASSSFINLNQTIASGSILAGDSVRIGARIALDAGSTGISATACELRWTDATPTTTIRNDIDSGGATLTGSNNLLNSAHYDGPTAAPASEVLQIGSSYSSRSARPLNVYFVSGVAVSAVIRIGRITCRKA